jgi:hypothetical protein
LEPWMVALGQTVVVWNPWWSPGTPDGRPGTNGGCPNKRKQKEQ